MPPTPTATTARWPASWKFFDDLRFTFVVSIFTILEFAKTIAGLLFLSRWLEKMNHGPPGFRWMTTKLNAVMAGIRVCHAGIARVQRRLDAIARALGVTETPAYTTAADAAADAAAAAAIPAADATPAANAIPTAVPSGVSPTWSAAMASVATAVDATTTAFQAQRSQHQREMAEMTARAERAEGQISLLRPRLVLARERHEESLERLEDATKALEVAKTRADTAENERNQALADLANARRSLAATTEAPAPART
ncbi:MAG: hypothetical protein M1815_002027 [Lichina confinis]|nr:MAG: hypothetical protein M1815_002027 [Lichina confinis]